MRGGKPQPKTSKARTRILSELEKGRANTIELADRLGLFPWDVQAHCRRLAEAGRVKMTDRVRLSHCARLVNVWELSC